MRKNRALAIAVFGFAGALLLILNLWLPDRGSKAPSSAPVTRFAEQIQRPEQISVPRPARALAKRPAAGLIEQVPAEQQQPVSEDQPTASLRVTVLADTGGPIPRARVRWPGGSGLTDYGGVATVDTTELDPGPIRISVSAQGFVPLDTVDLLRGTKECTLVLASWSELAVVVQDHGGRSIDRWEARIYHPMCSGSACRADFVQPGMGPQRVASLLHEVSVVASGYVPALASYEPLPGSNEEVVVRLSKGRRLAVQLDDVVTGLPVSGVSLHVIGENGYRAGVSDPAGVIELFREPGSSTVCSVRDRRFWPVVVSLAAGEHTSVAVPLVPCVPLSGVAFDGAGEPLRGEVLDIRSDERRALKLFYSDQSPLVRFYAGLKNVELKEMSGRNGRFRVQTDAEGRFSVEGLLPWTPGVHVTRADSEDASVRAEIGDLPGPGIPLNVQLWR